MSRHPAFTRAIKECERWGVIVIFPEGEGGPGRFSRPNDYAWSSSNYAAIDRVNGVVVWGDLEQTELEAASLIHEMMHVVVWRELGIEINRQDEEGPALAVEAEACRRLRCAWREWMSAYNVDVSGTGREVKPWSKCSTYMRSWKLEHSRVLAEHTKLLSYGKPTYKQEFYIHNRHRKHVRPSSPRQAVELNGNSW